MSSASLLLNASRCMATFSLLVGMNSHAAPVVSAKAKDVAPSAVSATSEPPSFALLGLGLVAIGLHGLGRSRRR